MNDKPRLIDADVLCEGRVENDPVVIAVKCAPTIETARLINADTLLKRINSSDISKETAFYMWGLILNLLEDGDENE